MMLTQGQPRSGRGDPPNIYCAAMRTSFRQGDPGQTAADTLCVGLFEDEGAPVPLDEALGGALGRLVAAGEAKGGFKKTALLHPDGAIAAERVISVGLGKRADFDHERARVGAAVGFTRARGAGARSLAWAVPEGVDQRAIATAITEGVLLAAYRFDRYKTSGDEDDDGAGVADLELVASDDAADAVDEATVVTEAQNRARDLQNLPANELTPTRLAEHALSHASEIDGLEAEAFGPDRIAELGMGGLLAVAKGSDQEPRLIVMRYERGGGERLGLVGKAVTFDTGGISIKPAGKMEEMKMDMSGGAAVIEATAAIARLGLPVRLLTVVPATENMPSGHATRPGDIIRISNGKTVEVNNTDAEGRLILADALSYAASSGAGRIVDLATLTGAIVTALGSTYAGLFSNDDELAGAVVRAGEATGEIAWRLPLHPDYKDLTRGKVADLVNVSDQRKASSAYAASFLEEFVDGRPWVHLDIAGTAWGQDNRDYVGKGASGWGVRLLVELARAST
jgi:leucyl aminopeptidase